MRPAKRALGDGQVDAQFERGFRSLDLDPDGRSETGKRRRLSLFGSSKGEGFGWVGSVEEPDQVGFDPMHSLACQPIVLEGLSSYDLSPGWYSYLDRRHEHRSKAGGG